MSVDGVKVEGESVRSAGGDGGGKWRVSMKET